MRGENRFATVRTDGGLLPVDLLARIAEGDKGLEGLDATGYHLAPGERLNEAISRSWNRLLGAWENFATALADAPETDRTATALTRSRWSLVLFQELGYGQLQTAKALDVDGKEYPVSHLWGAVPVHLVGARVDLDRRTSGVAGAARMSPHGLVQELLNRSDDYLWGFVSNGLRLRLLRDNVSLTRQAFVEFDLEAMLTGQAYADFVVLWLLCHQSRVEGDVPGKCILERWSAEAAQRGTRALDQLRGAVESAIATLGEGFLAHPANGELRDRLRSGDLDRQDYYRQLLRLVYRLLFVSVAEARDVLSDPAADPTDKERYRRFYSIERIRALAETRRGGPHGDLWTQLQLVFRAFGSDTGCPELALPALGSFLWSAEATPSLDTSQLANRHLLDAVRVLSSTREGKVTRTVDYRNLGSEELGSVYESLLELHPELNVDARIFSLSTAAGHERKTTGSYYTPTSLIKELLDSALDPVLAEAAAAADPEAAILDLKVLDPACGSGHFLIAAANRIAKYLASSRTGEEEPSPDALRTALRDVVGRCIHGIDLNEMAVELCKVSLWLEALDPGKPLSFLDHHIVQGNPLLGSTPRLLTEGIPDSAFAAVEGDDKKTVSALKKRNKAERDGQQLLDLGAPAELMRPVVRAIAKLDAVPDGALAGIAEKRRRFAELQTSPEATQLRLVADAWCTSFMLAKTPGAPILTHGVWHRLGSDPRTATPDLLAAIEAAQDQYRFLHPHLAFPHVFRVPDAGQEPENPCTGWDGGFNLVIGNPPWGRLRLEEREWFAHRAPSIAATSNAKLRAGQIAKLKEDDPPLHAGYRNAKRLSEQMSHFAKWSGHYPLCGGGETNYYGLFAELMQQFTSRRGRVGAIVQSSIITDETYAPFFRSLVEARALVSVADFENNETLFPGVGHGRMRFCLLTFGVEKAEPSGGARFLFLGRSASDLSDHAKWIQLSADDFALINPVSKTCPVFRSVDDARVTKEVYRRFPTIGGARISEIGDQWGLRLHRVFDTSSESSMFLTTEELEGEGSVHDGRFFRRGDNSYAPTLEGKMVAPFDHRSAHIRVNPNVINRQQQAELTSDSDHLDPCFYPDAYLWVQRSAVAQRIAKVTDEDWVLTCKRVSAATNWRTMVACLLPTDVAVSYTLYCVSIDRMLGPTKLCSLLCTWNSFVFDFFVRQKTMQPSLPMGVIYETVMPSPSVYDASAPWDSATSIGDWMAARAVELTATSWDLVPFARAMGFPAAPFRWDPSRRALIRAELDACCFHTFGLERSNAVAILDSFPKVKAADVTRHGEYRTERLILECYDAMAEAIRTGKAYETILDPAPADPGVAHPERR